MRLTQEIIDYIENRRIDYENRYEIKIYYWFVRKSTLRGMGRRTSDLDVAFVFQNLSKKPREIIFERADRRNEFQCWDIEDVLEIIAENKKRAIAGKEFEVYQKKTIYEHYVLDYYNGFYCSFGNELKKDNYNFMNSCGGAFNTLYEPIVAAKLCFRDMESQLKSVKKGYCLSLNQYLNAVWSGLAGIHFLSGGQPGDVNINKLAESYLKKDDAEFICKLVHYFRRTIQKQSNYGNIEEINRILQVLKEQSDRAIDAYSVVPIDVEAEVIRVREYLRKEE